MIRIFVDSSELFAAAYSSRGFSRDIILKGVKEDIKLVVSKLVFAEVALNLEKDAKDKLYLLEFIKEFVPFEFVRATKKDVLSAAKYVELKDAPIVAAAKKAGVDLLVTLDRKHLLGKPEISKFIKAQIVTPKEAVEIILIKE